MTGVGSVSEGRDAEDSGQRNEGDTISPKLGIFSYGKR